MLDGNVSAEIVIVGGGYTGMSCALHLAEAGRRVVLLEGQEIGFGGAGRNVGLINAGLWLAPADVSGSLGPVYGERLLELLGEGPALVMALIDKHRIDCELQRNGTLHCAVGPAGLKEIREREAQWQRRGAPVRVLDAKETASRLGTSAYAGSLLDLRAGTLQPLAVNKQGALRPNRLHRRPRTDITPEPQQIDEFHFVFEMVAMMLEIVPANQPRTFVPMHKSG